MYTCARDRSSLFSRDVCFCSGERTSVRRDSEREREREIAVERTNIARNPAMTKRVREGEKEKRRILVGLKVGAV